ncbi:MAG: alpha/beta hydrolase [Anaerolineaceae bacterium]|jgi:acetyl esterase/lipase|nr:alpha/beta hydrolase [Anaerolineaceae bacterium]
MSPINPLTRKMVSRFFPSFSLSVDAQRAKAEKMAHFFRLPKGMQCQPVDADGVPGEWFIPAEASDGVILFLHGGAYALGAVKTYRDLLSRLAKAAGVKVLAIDYRLAPEHPHPAAVEDAVAAYHWLLGQGIAPSQIVIAGDSAGGGLTLAALLALRDDGRPLPAGAVCISPWTDRALTGDSMREKADAELVLDRDSLAKFAALYAGGQPLTAPLISPLYADLTGLPPLLIQVGTDELLLDDARRFAHKAEAAGADVKLTVWEGMFHVFHMFPFFTETREAVAQIAGFVRERI